MIQPSHLPNWNTPQRRSLRPGQTNRACRDRRWATDRLWTRLIITYVTLLLAKLVMTDYLLPSPSRRFHSVPHLRLLAVPHPEVLDDARSRIRLTV